MRFPIKATPLTTDGFVPLGEDGDDGDDKRIVLTTKGPVPANDHHCTQTFYTAYPWMYGFRNAVDVGCRDGEFSRFIAEHFQHVYGFDPRYKKLFQRNVDARKADLFICALGDEVAEITMYGGTHNPTMNHGRQVQSVPLDSFELTDVDLIKIDVEGFEKKVLQGAEDLITRCRPMVIIEQNEVALPGEDQFSAKAWLEERDYVHVSTCPRGWDYVMVPKEKRVMDNCKVCLGEKGGTPGNENVIDGVVTCDYCHAAMR